MGLMDLLVAHHRLVTADVAVDALERALLAVVVFQEERPMAEARGACGCAVRARL